MIKTNTIAILMLLSLGMKAQTIEPDSLHFKSHIFRVYPDVMNRETRLSRKEEIDFFSKVPECSVLYKTYRKQYAIGLASFGGFFGAMILSSVGFDTGNGSLQAAGIVLSTCSFASTIVFISLGDAHLKKAIKIYNRVATSY